MSFSNLTFFRIITTTSSDEHEEDIAPSFGLIMFHDTNVLAFTSRRGDRETGYGVQ